MIIRKEYNNTILYMNTYNDTIPTMICLYSKEHSKIGLSNKTFTLLIYPKSYIKKRLIPNIKIDLSNLDLKVGYCLNISWLNVSLVTWL